MVATVPLTSGAGQDGLVLAASQQCYLLLLPEVVIGLVLATWGAP